VSESVSLPTNFPWPDSPKNGWVGGGVKLAQPILHSQLVLRCISARSVILYSGGSLDFDFTYLQATGLLPHHSPVDFILHLQGVSSTAVLSVALPAPPRVHHESIGG
jgi:hypothetical protein